MTRISGTGGSQPNPPSPSGERRPQVAVASGARRQVSAPLSGLSGRRAPRTGADLPQPSQASTRPHVSVTGKRRRDAGDAVAAAGTSGAMPVTKTVRRGPVSCVTVAGGLKMLADNPLTTPLEVARRLDRGTLPNYIGREGLKKPPEAFKAMPDYAEHAESMQDSLRRMGHPEQADALADASVTAGVGRERQWITARMVYDALSTSQREGGRKQPGSMRDWTDPASWASLKLPERLAKTEDYAEWRGPIEQLAKAMNMLPADQHLPEPAAKARRPFGADTLVDALRVVQRRKQAAAEGRPDRRSWKPSVREDLGLGTDTVFNWIASNGRLRKLPTSVSTLPGYEGAAEQIRQLLADLGHADLAAEMPEGAGQSQRMSAAKIAKGLTVLAENPGISMKNLELRAGIAPTQLKRYLGIDGGPMPIEKIADMPDYATHFKTMRAGLLRLGRRQEADALPVPQDTAGASSSASTKTSARELVREADAQLHKVVDVALALRDGPGKSLDEVTPASGRVRQLARMLLDERGAVRPMSSIEPMLSDVDADARTGLERLLRRLAVRIDPSAAMQLQPGAPMKPVLLTAWGHTPDRKLIVDRSTSEPTLGARDRLRGIYASNRGLERAQRSHAGNRGRQVLRWLGTALKQAFPEGHEIQCYFRPGSGPGPGTIFVSSNLRDVNERIETFLAGEGLDRLMDEAGIQRPLVQADRKSRHGAKLAGRMNPAADPHPTPESDAIFAAIAERRFHVPLHGHVFDDLSTNLHAERRIQKEVSELFHEAVDMARLAGTMRPCGSCADELGAAPEVHRGPFWTNRAAQAGTLSDEAIARDAQAGIGTSITRARNGKLTFDHDTDSDSDAELAD